jgi:hypothetical protein
MLVDWAFSCSSLSAVKKSRKMERIDYDGADFHDWREALIRHNQHDLRSILCLLEIMAPKYSAQARQLAKLGMIGIPVLVGIMLLLLVGWLW